MARAAVTRPASRMNAAMLFVRQALTGKSEIQFLGLHGDQDRAEQLLQAKDNSQGSGCGRCVTISHGVTN